MEQTTINFCQACGSEVKQHDVDGVTRFTCQNQECSHVYWNNPTPVVAALVKHEGRYIIARNAAWPKDIFSLITGFLEAKENPDLAVLREVKEELDLDGEISHYLGHYMLKEKNQLILAYEVEAAGEIALNEELAELKHLAIGELGTYDFNPLYITQAVIAQWKKVSHQC